MQWLRRVLRRLWQWIWKAPRVEKVERKPTCSACGQEVVWERPTESLRELTCGGMGMVWCECGHMTLVDCTGEMELRGWEMALAVQTKQEIDEKWIEAPGGEWVGQRLKDLKAAK